MFPELGIGVKVEFLLSKFVHNLIHKIFVLFRLLVLIIYLSQSPFDLVFQFLPEFVGGLHRVRFTLTRK
mgnify:CR=1 FL=1